MKNTPILKPLTSFLLSMIWVVALALPNSANAGIAPILDNEKLKYHAADASISSYLESADYNQKTNYFSLKTLVEVEMMQILNISGELEFQIPVNSKLLHIAIDDFESGNYIVNLKFKGRDEFMPTALTKK